MGRKVYVVGVGMTKFEKPGLEGVGLPGHGEGGRQQGARGRRHPYETVEQACVGYCYGDSTCGQRAVYSSA